MISQRWKRGGIHNWPADELRALKPPGKLCVVVSISQKTVYLLPQSFKGFTSKDD